MKKPRQRSLRIRVEHEPNRFSDDCLNPSLSLNSPISPHSSEFPPSAEKDNVINQCDKSLAFLKTEM